MRVASGDAGCLEELDGQAPCQSQAGDPDRTAAREQQSEGQVNGDGVENVAETFVVERPADGAKAGQQSQSNGDGQRKEDTEHPVVLSILTGHEQHGHFVYRKQIQLQEPIRTARRPSGCNTAGAVAPVRRLTSRHQIRTTEPSILRGTRLMATPLPDRAGRKLVVAPVLVAETGVSLLRIIPIWIASAAVHGAVLGLMAVLFMFLNSARASTADDPDDSMTATTQIENEPKEIDITKTDLGDDERFLNANNVDRIEDVLVPGLMNPTQAAGVPDAPADAARRNVLLLPGMGNALIGPQESIPHVGPPPPTGGRGEDLLSSFPGRSPSARDRMLRDNGGNARSEASVARGLEWMALHQAQDGHWSLHDFNHYAREKPRPAGKVRICNCEVGATNRNDVAATGFGLLPFLAGGITHKPSKVYAKDYSKTVDGGLNFLMSKQSKDGSYSGDMYAHGIAAIAMCEAYGLTSDPKLKQSAQRALNYIVYAQDNAGGGWRYAPKQPGDLSVTGWQLMALKSGQMSGLSVPKNTLKLSEKFLDASETSNKGGYAYVPANGQGESITMTSVGLLCRQYSGVNPRNPGLLSGVQRLKAFPPDKLNNIYYLYYATQVMHHMQGESWNFWNLGPSGSGKGGIRDTLISQQDTGATPKHPHQAGSWGGSPGGRIMATSLSLLCLEVYYRHLPLYRRDREIIKDGK
jgi:hypothetical protein